MSDAAEHAWHCPGIAVIGGGPAGLMAAEAARAAGVAVDLFEAKPSVGRKFLIAGRGGLNLTHSDSRPVFDQRYSRGQAEVGAWLDHFDADALRAWAKDLGVDTFVGTSGRVFPTDMKAAPLLRAWVHRLREQGVRFHMRQRWTGFDDQGRPILEGPDGPRTLHAKAVVLALGGGSWPQLGSDGAWLPWLAEKGVPTLPLQASNCGFDVGWTEHISSNFAGSPLKPIVAHWRDVAGQWHKRQGECVITSTGLEGSLLYAIGPDLRDLIQRDGSAEVQLDLLPAVALNVVLATLKEPRAGRSLSEIMRRKLHLDGAKAALIREVLPRDAMTDHVRVASAIKALPIRLAATRPIAEAISTAGGVSLAATGPELHLSALPGWFVCGEMLAWDAPTGGYLLSACFASGKCAGEAAARSIL